MKKCAVMGCRNQDDQGGFVKGLCDPCYDYIVNKHGHGSTAQQNAEFIARMNAEIQYLKTQPKELYLSGKIYMLENIIKTFRGAAYMGFNG